MSMDLMALATTTVTAFLMPYAKAGLEKIASAFTEQLGKQAADYAGELTGKVWNLVTSAFHSPKEQHTLELFTEDPDAMQTMLVKKLHEKLTQDAALAETLANLLNQPGPDGTATGAQIMNAGIAGIADLRGADFSNAKGVVISAVVLGDQSVTKPAARQNG